jgi:hypothetical protein
LTLVRSLSSVVLAAIAVSHAFAQTTGGLRVRVIDSTDKSSVVGAAVTLSNSNKLMPTTTVVTDQNGFALFPVLRVGAAYLVAVVMDGYAGIRQDTHVPGGSTKDLVIALAPEQVERITVTDEKPALDLDQNQAATKFSSDFIRDLPVSGRFYQNVLVLAPGVQDPDGDGNPNVGGARDRDFKTSVGGISNVDPLTGQFLSLVTSDSIEDLTVVTAGAGAAFGRAQGGFAQIVQKQGGNDFEGVFGFLYRSHALDGSGATGLTDSQLPDFYLYQPSLQVSGPIVRNTLWYRLSEEYIARQDPVVVASTGATESHGTEQFSTDNQLTWQISDRNRLALTLRADPRTTTHVGVSSIVPTESTEQFQWGGPTYVLGWTAPYSPNLLVDSTVAYQDTHLEITPTTTGVPNACLSPAYLKAFQCFSVKEGTISGSAPRTWSDARQRISVRSDATYFAGNIRGVAQQLKFGFVIENERYTRTLERRPTMLQDSSWDPFSRILTLFYSVTTSLEPRSAQSSAGTTWALYGEDVIRPIPNLSISVGLRIEQEQISAQGFVPFDPQSEADAYRAAVVGLSPAQRIVYLQRAFVGYEDIPGTLAAVSAQFPLASMQASAYLSQLSFWRQFRRDDDITLDNRNVAPRLSIAWDPWNDGKSKLSASWGRYYDKIFLAVPASEAEPILGTFPTTVAPHIGLDPTFSTTTVDRGLKTPYQDEWSLALERELWQESSISLRYIHRSFQNQLQDVDINQVPGDYGRCQKPLTYGSSPFILSPGVGSVTDTGTGETYEDTDPGNGDGRLDDCYGDFALFYPDGPGGFDRPKFPIGDGIPDLYILNPGWGNIFQIGNYNTAQYDGVTLEFVRRQYKNWQMEASYTWSKATGNGEDYNLVLGDDRASLADEAGYQSYDVRHALKINATAIVPGGIRLGGAVQWQSGLPYSILERHTSAAAAPPDYGVGHTFYSVRTDYPTGQRNDQRNAAAWNFDAKIAKDLALRKDASLQLTAEIFNVFGQNTYVIYDPYTKSGQQLNGSNDAYRRFGRQYQVGVRVAF